jgi:phage tail tape-measure protein
MSKLRMTISVLVLALVVTGCYGTPLSTREKGTGVGAVLGAGTGAIIGAAVGAPAAGAAIGGGLGAATGFVVGNELQNREVEAHQTQSQVNSQQSEITQQRAKLNG